MSAKVLKHAVIYTGEEKIEDGYVRFTDKILNVGPASEYQAQAGDDVEILRDRVIVPGFIDVHAHGGYSYDAMDGDADQIAAMAQKMMTNEGVTTLFATTMTQSDHNIEHAMAGVKAAAAKNPVIQGIHLEGPFISPVFKGAQPEEYIKDPDTKLLAHWNELSGNMIKLITYAPEDNGAAAFEDYCLSHGIVPSVGHSNATRAQMMQSKATHVTHLYNAQREFKHREPGVTGHAMLENSMTGELICDGFHIVPDMIKLALELKGVDRIELVTDSMRAKGMPEGESELGGQKVFVKDKQARLADGTLAGSVLQYPDAFVNIMRFTGCSVADAVKMSSGNQAKEFNLTQKGYIIPGKDADMNLFDSAFKLQETYSFGQAHHAE
ncbi:N-acetylglucosamine-6-phosphate deacetylase [Agrilactobacillus yilanensis]|uniref:N-acetylglucosamine-6-phosphate deacetylase n=1 Tax=Agrilactobacillus yilanensis TaxID=2485997 RepID=A0ABW4J974_9LACO|nr:N-acetylglucosamine-6-phosphate deacetylase [Agrilactobacillus yilanensis]